MSGRTEDTKTFERLPKSSQMWLIRLGTGGGGSDNPTWPVATAAHYKQDISALTPSHHRRQGATCP